LGLKGTRMYENDEVCKDVKCYRKYWGLLIKKQEEEIVYRNFNSYCKLIIRKVSSMNMILGAFVICCIDTSYRPCRFFWAKNERKNDEI
jgi:hypothetical protein